MASQLLTSGYSSIISSTPDRTTLSRVIHATIVGIDTEASNKSTQVSENEAQYNSHLQDLKILVGEDNEINKKVIKHIPEYENHVVTLANNGEEVLDIPEEFVD